MMSMPSTPSTRLARVIIMLALICAFSCGDVTQDVHIVSIDLIQPVNGRLFQRNGDNNAIVSIEGALLLEKAEAAIVEVRYFLSERVPSQGTWKNLEYHDGEFFGQLTVPAGGWYTVELRVMAEDDQVLAGTSVDKIGVGELFITAGQSNSASFGATIHSPDDRVSAWNDNDLVWQHAVDPQPVVADGWGGDGGSPWSRLGDLLVAELNLPIGFISCGQGRSSIAEWLPSSNSLYFDRIVTALGVAGENGVRAVLWHQGENDASEQTAASVYADSLESIIESVREEADDEIPFGVAKASHLSDNTEEAKAAVREGQQIVINSVGGVFPGPDTDQLGLEYRVAGEAHFNDEGLWLHAEGWQRAIRDEFFVTAR